MSDVLSGTQYVKSAKKLLATLYTSRPHKEYLACSDPSAVEPGWVNQMWGGKARMRTATRDRAGART